MLANPALNLAGRWDVKHRWWKVLFLGLLVLGIFGISDFMWGGTLFNRDLQALIAFLAMGSVGLWCIAHFGRRGDRNSRSDPCRPTTSSSGPAGSVPSTLGGMIPHTFLQLFRGLGLVFAATLLSGYDSLLLWGARANEPLAVAAAMAVGSNINVRDEHGLTPLHWAIKEKSNEIAIQLLVKGADIEASNNMKATPLHIAAVSDNLRIAKELLARGANISATSLEGWTALHFTVANDSDQIASLLIAKGIELNARTVDGNTALHFASQGGRVRLAKELLSSGARTDLLNSDGKTALQVANENGKTEVESLLRSL